MPITKLQILNSNSRVDKGESHPYTDSNRDSQNRTQQTPGKQLAPL